MTFLICYLAVSYVLMLAFAIFAGRASPENGFGALLWFALAPVTFPFLLLTFVIFGVMVLIHGEPEDNEHNGF